MPATRRSLLLSPVLATFFSALVAGASPSDVLVARDGHGHHHGAPLLQLNETEVTMYHSPTPPSYYTIDFEDPDKSIRHYPGLMILHILLMSAAFFVALPAAIAMRSVKHSWHGLLVIVFYTLCALGCAASALYTKLTPNMYEGEVHSSQGYLFILFAVFLSSLDIIAFVRRLVSFGRTGTKFALKPFWHSVVLGHDQPSSTVTSEYQGLVEEPEEYDEAELKPPTGHHVDNNDNDDTAQWANDIRHHHQRHAYSHSASSDGTLFSPRLHRGSQHSDDTLQDQSSILLRPAIPLLRRIGSGAFATAERVLVFAGFIQLLTGITVYTGGCRENYINGCLAHLIKGGIFWCYGLVSFARFLGSFSELGWAWNRAPSGNYPSAEFVESFVIFLYGIMNTWMERFGANPGDPFTTKQVQHISIAVMFWFAGLIGMGIESKLVRRWLASSAAAAIARTGKMSEEVIAEPPSYSASFNPFPALVIGVTGAAMSAHAQTYLFQVQIHALWGYLLLGFSVLRCLTYFFLWLGPPRSILPSRPPTEALGSFFLSCGGLMFIFSTEEITIAAMRRGRDDMMMFLNVAVAMTCFAFCWTFCVVAFKGWLKARSSPKVSYHSSA